MTERILYEVQDHIAYLWLNRPEKLNGLDMPMFQQVVATAKKIRKDKNIRAVILAAKGDSFCAGLDFKAVSKNPSMIAKVFLKWPWTKQNLAQEIAHCFRDLPVPVICAIHGNCFGGGLQMALACDYRIATPEAMLSIMEIKWGLIPDMSGTVTLSRLTRSDIAMELTMTGRMFPATEALEYGLVSKLAANPVAEAEQLAQVIASKSPDAIAATKQLFKQTWKADTWRALRIERWIQARLLGRRNQKIAMQNGLSGKDSTPKPFHPRSF